MSFGPTAREATSSEVNIFIRKTDEFLVKREKLISPTFRAQVYATGNSELIADYESEVTRANAIKKSIVATVGAWSAFKRGYGAVTDVTSTVIGDAVDEIRSWFGYDPAPGFDAYDISPISGGQLGRYDISPISGGQLGALGAVQIVTAVWITGILAVMVLSIRGMDKIEVWVNALLIKKSDPSIPMSEALDKGAQIAARGNLFAGAAVPLLAAAAIAAFIIFGKKK